MNTPEELAEIAQRVDAALAFPGVGHLIATRGPFPICSLCGGRGAPIIDGKHLDPERFCDKPEAKA